MKVIKRYLEVVETYYIPDNVIEPPLKAHKNGKSDLIQCEVLSERLEVQ